MSPREGERYFLRLMTTVIPNATSFEDLRTADGTVYPTYRAAALAKGLLTDDDEWQ